MCKKSLHNFKKASVQLMLKYESAINKSRVISDIDMVEICMKTVNLYILIYLYQILKDLCFGNTEICMIIGNFRRILKKIRP